MKKAVACAMFDAFCKEVLRNAMIDYLRRRKHISLHELPAAEPEKYLGARELFEDSYTTDQLLIEYEECS